VLFRWCCCLCSVFADSCIVARLVRWPRSFATLRIVGCAPLRCLAPIGCYVMRCWAGWPIRTHATCIHTHGPYTIILGSTSRLVMNADSENLQQHMGYTRSMAETINRLKTTIGRHGSWADPGLDLSLRSYNKLWCTAPTILDTKASPCRPPVFELLPVSW
jgi:hypothetical protein